MEMSLRLQSEKEVLYATQTELLALISSAVLARNSGAEVEVRKSAGIECSQLKRQARALDSRLMKVDEALTLLGPVVPGINRRLQMTHYHYHNWIEVEKVGLSAAQIVHALGGDGYVNTPAYNAEVIAFLQNVHALCDSIPYVLNLYYRALALDSRKIGWNEETLTALCRVTRENGEHRLSRMLTSFERNELFQALQSIVNCAKHKHLVPIFYLEGGPEFAVLDGRWEPGGKKVGKFMRDVDHELLPLVMDMLALAQNPIVEPE